MNIPTHPDDEPRHRLADYTVAELVDAAEYLGFTMPTSMRRAELLHFLTDRDIGPADVHRALTERRQGLEPAADPETGEIAEVRHLPAIPEPEPEDDQPTLVDVPALLRHKLTLGTAEVQRPDRLEMRDRIYLLVEARAVKDGRATDADGLYYTAGLDCTITEISSDRYGRFYLEVRQARLDDE